MNNFQRNQAHIILSNVYEGMLLNIALEKYLYSKSNPKDYRYVVALVKGTLENKCKIEEIISKFVKSKTKKYIKILIQLATFELKFLESSKDYAVINEYVDIVKKSKFRANYKFVNAILRNIASEKVSIKKTLPEWLKSILSKTYSHDELKKIINYKTEGINCRIIDESILYDISTEYSFEKTYFNEINISKAIDLKNSKILNESKLIIQDHGSVMVGNIAHDLIKGVKEPKILDVCAAPGTKTIHLSEIPRSKVVACDISEKRLLKLNDNILRYNRNNILTQVLDSRNFKEEFLNMFDLVLCDLPCSGIGLIAKKPDILLNMNPDKIEELKKLQVNILKNAIKYLKKGGYLICSTCTIIQDENINLFNYLNSKLKNIKIYKKDYLQFVQGIDDCDGFFITVFKNE